MKERKRLIFRTTHRVVKIDCKIICGDVIITGGNGTEFTAERTRHSRLKISESDGVIKIRQTGKPLFHRAEVMICVPSLFLPDVSVKSEQGRIDITGVNVDNLFIQSRSADVILSRSSFASAELRCERLKLYGREISAERSFDCIADNGGTLMDNVSCSALDIKYKNGDTGISELVCPDAVLSSEHGSLNVILKGACEDYTLNVLSKNGTCNRESVYGGTNKFKAYTEFGNIVVDFTEKTKEVTYYGNDDVAEDSCGARRS